MGEISFEQCFGYAGGRGSGIGFIGGVFVCLFYFKMSLKFRVDIRSRGDSLRNLSFVKAEGSDALPNLSQYKLDFSKLKKSASHFPGF